MNIQVSVIKNALARRTAMCVLFPFLAALAPALGLLRGVVEVFALLERLVLSWGPVWRGDAVELPHAEIGVISNELRIHIPIDLLAYAAEHAPCVQGHGPQDPADYAAGKFRITDPAIFARSVGRAMRESTDESGGTLLHDFVDDAIERVVENADEGFVWPNVGIGTRPREEPLPIIERNGPLD